MLYVLYAYRLCCLSHAGPDCFRHYEFLLAGNIVYVPDDPSLHIVSAQQHLLDSDKERATSVLP